MMAEDKIMKNNVTSNIKTAFLKGADLVNEAIKKCDLQSENYNYPIKSYGDIEYSDNYFEIWTSGKDWNGKDWNIILFLLKKMSPNSHNSHEAVPIILFDNIQNYYDFKEIEDLLKIICKIEENKRYCKFYDFKTFIQPLNKTIKKGEIIFYLVEYSHICQKPIEFYLHQKYYDMIIKRYLDTGGKE